MRRLFGLILVILLAVGVYYYYSRNDRNFTSDVDSVKEYTEDAATTSAVKAALSLNKQVSSLDIRVETTKSNVTLSGEVPSADDKRVAEEITRGTKGVSDVVNNIKIVTPNQTAKTEKKN